MIKDKLIAAAVHIVFSIILTLISYILIYQVWYSYPFNIIYNVESVFILLLLVDLILGPLLTFIVYKKGKKTLKLDLTVIVVLQLAAYTGGMWNIAQARPAWLVNHKDVVYAITPAFINNPEHHFKRVSVLEQNWGMPKLVQVDPLIDDESVIYDVKNYSQLNYLHLKKDKIALAYVKQADEKFYNALIEKYSSAEGYMPIITDASNDIPILLLDKNGTPLGIELVKNELMVNGRSQH
ncbi:MULTISPECIES: hypothetical protein [unclassified Acinetobacter]